MRLLQSFLRKLPLAVIASLMLTGPGESQDADPADAYLALTRAVMAETATAADVDALLALYADDVVYEHPRVGIRIKGSEQVRRGLVAFLGRTRNPEIERQHRIEGEAVRIVTHRVAFEADTPDGWQPVERMQIVVLELDASHQITRIIDYW